MLLKSYILYIWAILWLVQMDEFNSIVGEEIVNPLREYKNGSETEWKKSLIDLTD